jgi:hypothetical protein
MHCINLKERFGDRYKIDVDETYYAERPEFRAQEFPWHTQILCQHGHICPWGGDLLAACTNLSGPVAKRLMALPFIDQAESQVGSDGVNAVFDVYHIETVLEIMKPRRRYRRRTEEEKRKLREMGRKYWFPPGQNDASGAQGCDPGGEAV